MNKFIEVSLENGKHIDRYKLTGISVDDFIDNHLNKDPRAVRDIAEEDYELHKKFEITFNVDDKFTVEHYVLKHMTKELRNDWNRFVRQQKRIQEFKQ